MRYIKDIFKEIGYSINDCLRRMCGGLSPGARLIVILSMIVVFTVGNLYFTISTIYNWGRESGRKEIPEVQHIDGLDVSGSNVQKEKRTKELIDSPIEIEPQENDSINSKFFIYNEKRTRKIRPC
jgi:hypothetical protein